ncbi:MAG: hypothetical protein NC429_00050 [Lachnospiraceae bacterium]|nr:hypothetical protein [Lachnospiraceae bacterium]
MDYYNQNNYRPPQNYRNTSMTFATVSMILGLGSIFTLLTIYLPVILGSLAIIFAVLSTDTGQKVLAAAKVGICTAAGSIALVITLIGITVSVLFTASRENLIKLGQQMDQMIESQSGISTEDITGESYEDLMTEFADTLGK